MIRGLQLDEWPRLPGAGPNVGLKRIRLLIVRQVIAEPTEVAITCVRRIVSFYVSIKALLAERDPDAPQEWFAYSVNRHLYAAPDKVVHTFVVFIPTKILAQGSGDLDLLGLLEEWVRGSEPDTWRSLVDLPTLCAPKAEDRRHDIAPLTSELSRARRAQAAPRRLQ